MSSPTFFELAQSIRDIINDVDPETGEINSAWEETRELFEKKASACIAYLMDEEREIESSSDLLETMIDRINARRRALVSFKRYVIDSMKLANITEVKHETGLFSAKLYPGRDISVFIENKAIIPPWLMHEPKKPPEPEPNKVAIKKALMAGEEVPGAKLDTKDRLEIR